jgi:hypothetical protein
MPYSTVLSFGSEIAEIDRNRHRQDWLIILQTFHLALCWPSFRYKQIHVNAVASEVFAIPFGSEIGDSILYNCIESIRRAAEVTTTAQRKSL